MKSIEQILKTVECPRNLRRKFFKKLKIDNNAHCTPKKKILKNNEKSWKTQSKTYSKIFEHQLQAFKKIEKTWKVQNVKMYIYLKIGRSDANSVSWKLFHFSLSHCPSILTM